MGKHGSRNKTLQYATYSLPVREKEGYLHEYTRKFESAKKEAKEREKNEKNARVRLVHGTFVSIAQDCRGDEATTRADV